MIPPGEESLADKFSLIPERLPVVTLLILQHNNLIILRFSSILSRGWTSGDLFPVGRVRRQGAEPEQFIR
jgi:hypothetical protein